MPETGKFITFEGIDGSGKSTLITEIKDYLENQKIKVFQSREPGGVPIAEEIRSLLLSDVFIGSAGETEALMMFAARFEHLKNAIIPALEKGEWVLCDRFTDSTFAYQVFGRGIDFSCVEKLSDLVHPNHHPDLTILLDLDTNISLKRITQKEEKLNRLDDNTDCFQDRVKEGYLKLSQKYPKRIKVVDATQSFDNVLKQTKELLDPLLS
jgi:dTMP kinase